jgi:hypothetical protein
MTTTFSRDLATTTTTTTTTTTMSDRDHDNDERPQQRQATLVTSDTGDNGSKRHA